MGAMAQCGYPLRASVARDARNSTLAILPNPRVTSASGTKWQSPCGKLASTRHVSISLGDGLQLEVSNPCLTALASRLRRRRIIGARCPCRRFLPHFQNVLPEYQSTADKSVRLYKCDRKSWLCVKNDFGLKPGLLEKLRGLTRGASWIADNKTQRTAGFAQGRGHLRVRKIDDRPVAENRAVNLIRIDTEPRVVSELLH